MNFANHPFFQYIAQYAYEPYMVYGAVFVMMLASGFGFPVPEEVYIISIGILAYMGANPDAFPPPPGTTAVVNGYEAAIVTTVAVIFADTLVFTLGRVFGRKIMQRPRFQPYFSSEIMMRINSWVKKYGIMAAFMFRFTPGVRFPAHVALGMLSFPAWQFIVVDGVAALISVPTQILLIYHFGESILTAIHDFKMVFLIAILIIGLGFFLRRMLRRPQPPGIHPRQ